MKESDGTRVWAAMLLKNDGHDPIKWRVGVGWSLPIFPTLLLLHACQFLGDTTIRFGHANRDIYPNVCAIGFGDVHVRCVNSTGFPCCWLAVPW